SLSVASSSPASSRHSWSSSKEVIDAPDLASTCSLSESTEMAVSAPSMFRSAADAIVMVFLRRPTLLILPEPLGFSIALASEDFSQQSEERGRLTRHDIESWSVKSEAGSRREGCEVISAQKKPPPCLCGRRMSPRFFEDDSPYARPSVPPGRRSVILRSKKKRLAGRRPCFRKGRFKLGALSGDESPGRAVVFSLRGEGTTSDESKVEESAASAVRRPVEREVARPGLRMAPGSDWGARTNQGGPIASSSRQAGSGTYGELDGPPQANPPTSSRRVHANGSSVKNLARDSLRPAMTARRSRRPERARLPGTCRI
ncbi:hypothetical protein FOZ61_003200, partial [Perkinsus olseni]